MNEKPLLFTADAKTAQLLIEYGFQMVTQDKTGFTFLNKGPREKLSCQFTHGKISYTDKLYI